MKGITNERKHSLGSLNIYMKFKHLNIEHKLHVVSDNFPIPCNGIIGKDFLKRHHCLIDYREMSLTIRPNGLTPATIEIQNDSQFGETIVPARSETFKMFQIRSEKFPCLIETQEIHKDIFIPTTIVHESNCWIRVLNVNNENIGIQTDTIKPKNINDYNICMINESYNSLKF